MVHILINSGASVHVEDEEGKSPPQYAENDDVIKLLKASGAQDKESGAQIVRGSA